MGWGMELKDGTAGMLRDFQKLMVDTFKAQTDLMEDVIALKARVAELEKRELENREARAIPRGSRHWE